MYYHDLSCYVFDYSALALSQLGPLLELSTLDCSSAHNNTAGFTQQRPIGSCTSYGQPWLYCTYIIYICCRLVIIMYMYRYIKNHDIYTCTIVDLFCQNRLFPRALKTKPDMWDVIRSPFQAKHINDSTCISRIW